MDFKNLLEQSGMNMKQFSEYFGIPYRTIQGWKAGERECPGYLLRLIAYKLKKEREERKMTKEKVLSNLKKLVGTEFDADEVICAFEDFQEDGETNIYIGDSHNVGYDKIAYIDTKNGTEFLFELEGEVIKDVWMS